MGIWANDEPSPVDEPPVEVDSSLELFRAVYRNAALPLPVRMRAAAIAIPFEQPKLMATAVTHFDGDFATRLDRAIDRSAEQPKVIEQPSRLIEAKAVEPQVTPAEMARPFQSLRRRA
jgi:hypothetical protein